MELTQRWTEVQEQEVLSEQEMVKGGHKRQTVLYSKSITLATVFWGVLFPTMME